MKRSIYKRRKNKSTVLNSLYIMMSKIEKKREQSDGKGFMITAGLYPIKYTKQEIQKKEVFLQ